MATFANVLKHKSGLTNVTVRAHLRKLSEGFTGAVSFGDVLKLLSGLTNATVREHLNAIWLSHANDVVFGYCSAQDMFNRFGIDEVIQRTDRNNTGLVNQFVLNTAMVDARNEIDGYLIRYQLPLATVPPALTRIACDIARYRLYDDQIIDPVDRRYKEAIAFLKLLANGTATLGIDISGNEIDGEMIIEFQGARPIFGR